MPTPEILTIPEMADYLRVHKLTLYRLIKAGKVPSFKIGSDYRFMRSAIEAWIKSLNEKANEN